MLRKALLLTAVLWLAVAGCSQVKRVGPIAMTVADMDRSIAFYSGVLTFEKVSDTELAGPAVEELYGVFGARVRVVRLKLGDEQIELTEFLAPRGRPIPGDSRSNDRWFQHIAVVVSDMDRAYQILRKNKVEFASSGPQRLPDWNPNAGGIKAFYFKDPDQHPVEIIYFPEGKGLAKWHQKSDKIFLGIDHTAIVIADTDASLRFYRDTLGFKVAGESDNYGTEQEHLNLIHGAHLHITSLRAPEGPGVEFLEYLAPSDGRNAPSDQHANDIVHRHTVIETDDANKTVGSLRQAKAGFISPGVISFDNSTVGYREGFLVRDPDGHAVEVVSNR
jgi:catechol 2,3-dioxygenase-like lactoylglutathione lyase family enzyme